MDRNYEVTVDVFIDRTVWRFIGYGDQPAKSEVVSVYRGFVELMDSNPIKRSVVARYAGAPGHYVVKIKLSVSQAWWKRLGLGDSSSLTEVKRYFESKTATFSDLFTVKVTKLASGDLPA